MASFPELFKASPLSRNAGNHLVLRAIQEALPCSPAFVEELYRTFASPDTTRSSIAMASLTIIRIIEEIDGKVPAPFIELAVQGLSLGCVFVVQHPQYRDDPTVPVRDRHDAEAAARDLDKDYVRVKNGVRSLVNIHLDPKNLSGIGGWKYRRDIRKLLDLFKPHIRRLERTLNADFSELIERTAVYTAQNRNSSDSGTEPVLIEPATVDAPVESGSSLTVTSSEPPPDVPLQVQVQVAGPADAEAQRQPETPLVKAPAVTTGGGEEKPFPSIPAASTDAPSVSGVQHQPSADAARLSAIHEKDGCRGSDASTRSGSSARSGGRSRYTDSDYEEDDRRRSTPRSEGRPRSLLNHGIMSNVLNDYGTYHYNR